MTFTILPPQMWITRQQAVEENEIERREDSSSAVSSVQLHLLDIIFALESEDK